MKTSRLRSSFSFRLMPRLWGRVCHVGLAALVSGFLSVSWAQSDYQVGERLPSAAPGASAAAVEFALIEWDDLIPPDWVPETLFEDLFATLSPDAVDALEDYDPQAEALLAKIRELWDAAPVVAAMDGRRVRLPGFVVPLETDGTHISEFLLVPYFGACIHVPPPPANQLIHVLPDQPIPAAWDMVPVWVSGTLKVVHSETEMGRAGYQLHSLQVEEYEEE